MKGQNFSLNFGRFLTLEILIFNEQISQAGKAILI